MIGYGLEGVKGQNRKYSERVKMAIACLVCVAICAIAAYVCIIQNVVSPIVLGVVLVSAVTATLGYVIYKGIAARKVRHTEEPLSREEALSILEQDVSSDKLKHVLRKASPETLEEVCRKISEVSSDNTSIITQVMEQIEDRKEILELLDLADANSSHVDENVRRRDFGRIALAGRLESYVVYLATMGNYKKIKTILEYDPSFIYSAYGTNAESIMKVASGNAHTECVQMLKEFHKTIVEGAIRGDGKYRKCDPMLSILQVALVDRECALDMFEKLAQSGFNMRSSDLFAVPRGLRKDFEDIFLKYCIAPRKIDRTIGDMAEGMCTTARVRAHATREAAIEKALEDFDIQLNTLEVPFSAADAMKLITRYSNMPDMAQSVLNNTSRDAVEVVEKFLADRNVQGASGVESTPLEVKVATKEKVVITDLNAQGASGVENALVEGRFATIEKALEDFDIQLNTLEVPFSAADAMKLITRYSNMPDMAQSVLNNTSRDAVTVVEKFLADLKEEGLLGIGNAPVERKVVSIRDKIRKKATHSERKAAVRKESVSEVVTEAARSAPTSHGLDFLVERQLDEKNVMLALENNGSREVIEYILLNATDSAVLRKACKKISELGENGGSSIMSKAIDSIRSTDRISDFLQIVFAIKDDKAKAVLSSGLGGCVVSAAMACKYEQVRAVVEYDPSCIYANSLDIMELAFSQGMGKYGNILKDLHKQIIIGTRNGDPRYKKCYPILSIIYISKIHPQEACKMLHDLLESGYILSKSDIRAIGSCSSNIGYALESIVSNHIEEQEEMVEELFPSAPPLNSNEEVIEYVLRNTGDDAAIEMASEKIWDPKYDAAFIIGRVINSMRDQVEIENFLSLIFNQSAAGAARMGLGSKLSTYMLRWTEQGSYLKIESILRFVPSAIYASVENTEYLDLMQVALEKNRLDCAEMLKGFHKKILWGLMLGDARYNDCSSTMSIVSISKVSTEEACELLIELGRSFYIIPESYKKWVLENAPAGARQALQKILYAEVDELQLASPALQTSTEGDKPHEAVVVEQSVKAEDELLEAAVTDEHSDEEDKTHEATVAEQPNEENEARLVSSTTQDRDTSTLSKTLGTATHIGKVPSSIGQAMPNISDTISQAIHAGSILYKISAFTGKRLTTKAIDAIKSHPKVLSAYDNTKAMLDTVLAPFMGNNDPESQSIAKIKETRETLGRDFSSDEAVDLLARSGRSVTANVVLSALLNSSTEAAKEVCKRIFDQEKDGIIATTAIANTKDFSEVKNLIEVVFDIVDSDLTRKQVSQVLNGHLFDSLRKGGYYKISGMLQYNPLYLYETEGGKDLIETALEAGKRSDAHMLKEWHKEIVDGYVEGRAGYMDYSVLSSVAYVSKVSSEEACEMLDALIESGYEITASVKKWLRTNFPEDGRIALDAVFEKRINKDSGEKSTIAPINTDLPSVDPAATTHITNPAVDVDHVATSGACIKICDISNDATKDKVDLKDGKVTDDSTQSSDISDDEGAESSVSTRVVNLATDTEEERGDDKVGSMVNSVTALKVSACSGADKIR